MKNTAVMSSPVGSWGELRFQMPGKTSPKITLKYYSSTLEEPRYTDVMRW